MNYWMRLENLKMKSVQRRKERYKSIYVWKKNAGMVPENGVHLVLGESRNGRLCKIPGLKPSEQTKREQSFRVAGPGLFNCLSEKLRNVTNSTLEGFKEQLIESLTCVPDEPTILGPMPHNFYQHNIILLQVARRRERLRGCSHMMSAKN